MSRLPNISGKNTVKAVPAVGFLGRCSWPVIKILRELSWLEWLKVACPRCGEEMTLYLTPPEEVDEALAKGAFLETVCSYC